MKQPFIKKGNSTKSDGAPVSGNGGVPPLPGTTRLSRSNGQQRGHTVRPDFLLQNYVLLATQWLHDPQRKKVCCQLNSSKPLFLLVPER